MLKPQDLLVALKLAALEPDVPVSFASLARDVGLSASEVFAATDRARACHLLAVKPNVRGADRFRPLLGNLREFLLFGARYVFPGEVGKPARGFRTAQDAEPLAALLVRPAGEPPVVWPHSEGDVRGVSLEPIFPSIPEAARKDARLREWLVLLDALRTGDARVRQIAAAEVHRLTNPVANAGV